MGEKLNITEAADTSHRFMTALERKLKAQLIKLLRKTHHNKYADRLEQFDVRLIPLSVDPYYSASISYDDGIINIGEGFLFDEESFVQLNVILRHELAHNLMMHQVRMAKKLPKYEKLARSRTMFDFLNIVADDEISNTRYTDEDKNTIRHMKINGQVLPGLVTEDHREDWKNLTLEQMLVKLEQEIREDNETLRKKGALPAGHRLPANKSKNAWNPTVDALLAALNAYQDIDSPSIIPGDLKKFIDDGCPITVNEGGRTKRLNWAKPYQELATAIYNAVQSMDNPLTSADAYVWMKKIADSSILDTILLFDDPNLELYTPEEKHIAEEVLKKYRSVEDVWYQKVYGFLKKKRISKYFISPFWDSMKGN